MIILGLEDLKKDKFKKSVYLALEKILVPAMADKTPVKTGHTAASWEIDLQGDDFYLVNTNGMIAKFLDEGTKPHIITPKNKKALNFEWKGREVIVKKVHHPGFEGRFFVKKALTNKSMWKEIEKEIQKKFTRA